MGKYKDLMGLKFERLEVIIRVENDKRGNARWLCRCSCLDNAEFTVTANSLLSGNTKSCGCLRLENNRTIRITHGKSNTRLYKIWQSMKDRCYNESCTGYYKYGARGITICDEWLDKESGSANFINWAMENGYSNNLTIDRINNNGNYEPLNCRWATNEIQSRNKRTYKNNTSGHKGVYLTKNRKKWRSDIRVNGKCIYLWAFDDIEAAVEARKQAETKYWVR